MLRGGRVLKLLVSLDTMLREQENGALKLDLAALTIKFDSEATARKKAEKVHPRSSTLEVCEFVSQTDPS